VNAACDVAVEVVQSRTRMTEVAVVGVVAAVATTPDGAKVDCS